MKSLIIILLSSIWILGVLTPPIVNLMAEDASFVSMNLNEEESQKEEKKDIGEEKILTNPNQDMALSVNKNNAVLFNASAFRLPKHITEIPLPPPELRF